MDWAVPAALASAVGSASSGVDVDLTEGRVLGAIGVQNNGTSHEAAAQPDGSWRLGKELNGRARVRLEAPLGAVLEVRAAGQAVRVPLLALLEAPQRTASQAPVNVGVQRVDWDALEVSLATGDGKVAPGARVPVQVGLNILTPEPTDVSARISAELRPIRSAGALWRTEQRQVAATNTRTRPSCVIEVPVPQAEGTYVLELRSSWEPVEVQEGSRLGRWFRRKRAAASSSTATRRVTLSVIETKPPAAPSAGRFDLLVDTVDPARLRGHRPSASGRAPLLSPGHLAWTVPESALAEARRGDLIRNWIGRNGAEPALLAPAESAELAWSAFGLKVPRPGRPHRLTLTIAGGHPSALSVALVAPGAAGARPRLLLDACASGLPVLEGGPPVSFSWLVWPDVEEPMLVLANRGSAAVRLGLVELTELADLPPPPALADVPPKAPRALGLYLSGPNALDRFGGGTDSGLTDTLGQARNLAAYVISCGATGVVVPDRLADRDRRAALDGQGEEDRLGPDRLDVLLHVLERQGLTAWLDVDCEGTLPGLPAPSSTEAQVRGLVRIDRRGAIDGPAYNPLNPQVQEALKRRLTDAVEVRKNHPGLAGLIVRLGSGPTLLGAPGTGLDDTTFTRFVKSTGLEAAGTVPGLGTEDPNRFATRFQFVSGTGRIPWLTWRAREIGSLYGELSNAVARKAPGVNLAVVTPMLDEGPAGEEARRGDLAGSPPQDAWRAIGLDFEHWPAGDGAPIVLRGVGLGTEDLVHDLSTSPELDAEVASRPSRGLLLDNAEPIHTPSRGLCLTARAMAEGPAGDELLGHALAALDARWAFVTASAVAGQEERIRQFATVFRTLPASAEVHRQVASEHTGVAVRTYEAGSKTYLALANDTPYPIRLEAVLQAPASASVVDLGRNLRLAPEATGKGRRLVLDLPPFGVAAVRVDAVGVQVSSFTPHHPSAVLASLEARKDDLSRTLTRLNRMTRSGDTGPPNPGFEPNIELTGARDIPRPSGWHAVGDSVTTVVLDPVWPHTGQASLRLDALAAPGGVACDSFTTPAGTSLSLHAWLRSDRPETAVQVQLESDQADQPFVYRANLVAQPRWTSLAIAIPNLPAGGLDRARIRFDLPAPARLWLDDVAVLGEGLSEPERRNARRTLLAALQAYREQRFADFARLAGSHWARQAEPGAHGSLEADRTSLRTAPPTALPASRRLR